MGAAVVLAVALFAAQAPIELKRAISHQRAGRFQEAASRYRDLLEGRPEMIVARVYLAETLWLSGDLSQALVELSASRRAAPKPLLPLLLSARMEGRESEELVLRLPSAPVRAKLLHDTHIVGEAFVPLERPAIVLASLGEIDLARADYRAAAEIDPFNADLHRQLAHAFSKASRHVEAIEAFENALALEPKDAASWGQLGSSALRLQWWDRAISAFERANELSGERPAGLLALGYAYERKPDFEKALFFYTRASELSPSWAQPAYRKGRTLIKLNRGMDAERELKRALEIDPDLAEARCFLGALYLDNGDVAEAIQELSHAVALSPRYAKARYYRAQAYLRAGRRDEATAELAIYEQLSKVEDVEHP